MSLKHTEMLDQYVELELQKRNIDMKSSELREQLLAYMGSTPASAVSYNGNGHRQLAPAALAAVHEAEGIVTVGWAKRQIAAPAESAKRGRPPVAEPVGFEAEVGALRKLWEQARAASGKTGTKIGITPDYLKAAAVQLGLKYSPSQVARAAGISAANLSKWCREAQAEQAGQAPSATRATDNPEIDALRLAFATFRSEQRARGKKKFDWPEDLLRRAIALAEKTAPGTAARLLDIKHDAIVKAKARYASQPTPQTGMRQSTKDKLKATWTPERREKYSLMMKKRSKKMQAQRREAMAAKA